MRLLMLPLTGLHKTRRPPVFDLRKHVTRALGLPFEAHALVSRDGYRLMLHRLPNPGAPPVLLMHGMLETSACFLASTKNSSLGQLLHRNGYDVWLGNHRGNHYSEGHTNPKLSRAAFWNFTALDMGRQDLPAFVDYVLQSNGAPSLAYFGHSLGAEIAVTALADPTLSKGLHQKIHLVGLAAPAITVHLESWWALLQPMLPLLEMLKPFDMVSALYLDHVAHELLTKLVCRELFCDSFVAGMLMTSKYDDPEAVRRSFAWYPSSFGSKVAAHILQNAKREEPVREYDYGPAGNMAMYKQTTPPALNFRAIRVPTAYFYGANDLVTGTIPSIRRTMSAMDARAVVFEQRYPHLGHHSFQYADMSHAPHWFARDLLPLLKLYPSVAERFRRAA